MTNLMAASHQWATRPADERFVSLLDMQAHFTRIRAESRALTVANRDLRVVPLPDHKGLSLVGRADVPFTPTHWAFGQLSALSGAPAGYLRKLPSPLAADCLNYGLQIHRDVEEVGLLLQQSPSEAEPARAARAATGPNYGRIWNQQILDTLVSRFGDGVTGDWRVPGEFGRPVAVTQANTTLYAGDRDMFVFLADEDHRIEIPDRRNGQPGSLARGFFVWNSEVGSATLGIAVFLYDYVCCNRIVWGAQEYKEIRIRHTSGAKHRSIKEVIPALETYANSSTETVTRTIASARQHRLDSKLDEFLASRFGSAAATPIKASFMLEEGRPMSTLWDVVTGATAWARHITWQDERVAVEREAGRVLQLAA